MTSFFDEDEWHIYVNGGRSLKPLASMYMDAYMEDVQLPEWEPLDTGIEPLTRHDSGAYDAAMTDTTEDFIPTPLLGSKEERLPYGFLNYKGEVGQPNPPIPMGPATFNEMLYPLTYDYDEETDMSRVGLTLQAPDWGKILGEATRE